MTALSRIGRRIRGSAIGLLGQNKGFAAVEFALIVPVMLLTFFGMVEVTSAVIVDRKLTLVARTLSDLTSQSISATSNDVDNFFTASKAILTPYGTTPLTAKISEIHIDPKTRKGRIQWSRDSNGGTPYQAGTIVTVADALIPVAPLSADIYLIWSEVEYLYKPITSYTMTDLTLKDQTYTRPRQGQCVLYNPTSASDPCPTK